MSRVQISAAAAILTVLAAVMASRAVRPQRPSIAALRARYFRTAPAPAPDPDTASWRRRAVHALATSELGLRLDARVGADVRAGGLTLSEVIGRAAASAVLAVLTSLAVVTALVSSGLLAPAPVLLALMPVAALLAVACVASDVRSRSRTARAALRQATADFIQLVAVSLTTSRSVEESIEFASRAGDGAGYEPIRRAVASAPQMGVTIWEALDDVGRTYDVAELRDLAASIQRQASVGASVEQTVSTLAASMRAKALDDLERAADRANSNLSGPTIGFVVGMVLLLAYPLAVRVSEAFHP
jgi:Flp pilus assembly protein TadB